MKIGFDISKHSSPPLTVHRPSPESWWKRTLIRLHLRPPAPKFLLTAGAPPALLQLEQMHAALRAIAEEAPQSNEVARLQHHLRAMMGWVD